MCDSCFQICPVLKKNQYCLHAFCRECFSANYCTACQQSTAQLKITHTMKGAMTPHSKPSGNNIFDRKQSSNLALAVKEEGSSKKGVPIQMNDSIEENEESLSEDGEEEEVC
mmetsp:Transcript_21451/g.20627  ORF Transcript_21451/g.20627 Transcript_21451/m.20627 type:complete len:112 (-) Transcript_21451:974-1309(-)